MHTHHEPGHALVFCLFLLLTGNVLADSENDPSSLPLKCRSVDDTLVCEFTVEKQSSGRLWEMETCVDKFCIKATVTKEIAKAAQRIEAEKALPIDQVTVKVGSHIYMPPFDKYGKQVAALLRNIPEANGNPLKSDLARADWYTRLGLAHRDQDSNKEQTPTEWTEIYSEASVQAFDQAIILYERIEPRLSEIDADDDNWNPFEVRLSMATAYSFLAESLQFGNDMQMIQEAVRHYRSAEKIFKRLLDSHGDDKDLNEALELNLADLYVRLGSLLLSGMESTALAMPSAEDSNQDMSPIMTQIEEAEQMLSYSVKVFRKHAAFTVMEQIQLANGLQHQASALVYLSRVPHAIQLFEEALTIAQKAFPRLPSGSLEEADQKIGIAELLQTLSDVHLQMGNYDEAKKHYTACMHWYTKYGVEVSPAQVSVLDSDETLSLYEQLLEDYRASLHSGRETQVIDDYRTSGELYFEPDNLYEADLHANIGAIHLSRDEVLLAMNHFTQAIDLYRNQVGEERAIADVKLNMALALLRDGDYDESARVHDEALEIYREVVGEGKNPLSDGMNEMPWRGSGLSGDSISEQPKFANAGAKHIVNERLINIDDYRQSLINMTMKADA